MAAKKLRLLLLLAVSLAVVDLGAWAKPSKDSAAAKTNTSIVRAAKEKKADEFPEEDTDMLMEPNDFAPITVLRSQEQQFHPPPTIHQQPFRPLPHPQARADVARHPVDSHSQAAQNYYPPFFREAPPLGHSRPYFTTPADGPGIPKYIVPNPEALAGGRHATGPRTFDPAILGSGDFGVLRGGTFYPEEEMPYHQEDNNGDFYGDPGNAHSGSPTEGFIQKYTYPEEQFADFRDFADINTPTDSAFSQFVVVYAAKNATKPQTTHAHPKNIFEQLELLDRQKEQEERDAKRQLQRASKSKTKLAKTKLQKKYKKKPNPKDLDYEPLLALS